MSGTALPQLVTKGHSPSSWLWRFCGLRILSSWLGLRLEARCGSADIHVESFISKSSLLTEVSSWSETKKVCFQQGEALGSLGSLVSERQGPWGFGSALEGHREPPKLAEGAGLLPCPLWKWLRLWALVPVGSRG